MHVEGGEQPEGDPDEATPSAALPLAPAQVAPEYRLGGRGWRCVVYGEVVVDHDAGCHRRRPP